MANVNNRSTIGAIVEEVTEGTPVAPSSATDNYIALQAGFTMSPAFEVITNEELQNSLVQAAPILGFENPTASLNHYLKHSGVEGQEPNFGLMFEAGFGAKEVEGTEYDTVGGSTAGDATTRGTVVVDAGEGVEFERGQPLLIKDATNGFRIRPVFSVSTDTLNLGFNLPPAAAPGSGVNLGQAVFYKPTTTGHKTFSTWYYRGNGGFTEMMAGSRPTTMEITATAGEAVNVAFTVEGNEYFYDGIEITSSDIYIDFTDDTGTYAAQVTAQFYKDPHELSSAIQTAMDGLSPETITCTYSDSDGKYTIATSTSTLFTLLWNTGTNTANTIADKIGFSTAADDTGATSYEGDDPLDFSAPQTPVYDSSSLLVAKNNEVLFGNFDDYVCFEDAKSLVVTIENTKTNKDSICAVSGRAGSEFTATAITANIVARITQYDADKFRRFRGNVTTAFQYSFGEKSGGNWVPGKAGMIFLPTTKLTAFEVQDTDGILEANITLTGPPF